MVVELSMLYCGQILKDSFFRIHFQFCAKIQKIFVVEQFYMSQMNPIEFVHNTTYSAHTPFKHPCRFLYLPIFREELNRLLKSMLLMLCNGRPNLSNIYQETNNIILDQFYKGDIIVNKMGNRHGLHFSGKKTNEIVPKTNPENEIPLFSRPKLKPKNFQYHFKDSFLI